PPDQAGEPATKCRARQLQPALDLGADLFGIGTVDDERAALGALPRDDGQRVTSEHLQPDRRELGDDRLGCLGLPEELLDLVWGLGHGVSVTACRRPFIPSTRPKAR